MIRKSRSLSATTVPLNPDGEWRISPRTWVVIYLTQDDNLIMIASNSDSSRKSIRRGSSLGGQSMPDRRSFLGKGAHLCAGAIAGSAMSMAATASSGAAEGQKFLLIGLVGSENPTRANF